MARLAYILDTNVIADYINNNTQIRQQLETAKKDSHTLYLCQPVYFEVLRGLLRVNATRKLTIFEQQVVPMLTWLPVLDADWRQAAEFWSLTVQAGKQLADTDLLIAALAKRLDAVIVSADNDFDALSLKRENWRI